MPKLFDKKGKNGLTKASEKTQSGKGIIPEFQFFLIILVSNKSTL